MCHARPPPVATRVADPENMTRGSAECAAHPVPRTAIGQRGRDKARRRRKSWRELVSWAELVSPGPLLDVAFVAWSEVLGPRGMGSLGSLNVRPLFVDPPFWGWELCPASCALSVAPLLHLARQLGEKVGRQACK